MAAHAGAHLQGEHIFNAVGDFAADMANALVAFIKAEASLELRTGANDAIADLRLSAQAFIASRNNAEFRTAPVGDPINDQRYSSFQQQLRTATTEMATGGPSQQTLGYINFNRLLDDVYRYTVDEKALAARRAELPAHRRGPFDTWVNATKQLDYDTVKLIRDAALAVARTR